MTNDARAVAARVLARVVTAGNTLPDALLEQARSLDDVRKRALVQELSYGTLRWYYRLDFLLSLLLQKPLRARDTDLRCLLLAGLYQLDKMSVPQHVAVHETVQATRALNKSWARGLLNAVLRGYQRRHHDLESAVADNDQSHYAHPAWLIEMLQDDWPEHWQAVLQANNARPPFSLRVNRLRMVREEYLAGLAARKLEARPLEHTSHGVLLCRPLPVEDLPGFSDGIVSVQDAAAQQAATLLQLAPEQRVLDACAAPGGKTAAILETVPQLSCVTALDIDSRRLDRTEENLQRLSLHADLVPGDASEPAGWWDGHGYDRILLDAPCSATGVIRRHPDIKLLRRRGDITALALKQTKILRALWPLLVPGGILLYCTCSVLAEENSRQVGRFLRQCTDSAEVRITAAWGQQCQHGRQILPGEFGMDGFYFACLRKTA